MSVDETLSGSGVLAASPRANGTAPPLADVAGLSLEQKRALLAELLKKKRAEPRGVPVSPIQERFWLLDQLEPDSAAYNWKTAIRLQGPLAVAVLERCINEIVRRHEILRTTFNSVDGQPVQIAKDALIVPLLVEDFQHVLPSQRDEQAQRRANQEIRCPFDLSRGPLIRTLLLRMAPEEHVLVLTIHHIVFDAWSLGVFVRELSALYAAFQANEPSPLPALSIQYADCTEQQRQWLQGQDFEKQLKYWKERLTGCKPVLELPTDFPRPAVQRFEGAMKTFRLSPQLTQRLKEFSREERVTFFMTLLAALQAMFYRYSGQEDIQVGCPIDVRNRGEAEGLIGCFVNTLVMRTDLSGNPTFRELLQRVRATAVGAYSHRELPFEKLVGAMQLERDMSRTALIQVSFSLRNTPPPEIHLPGLRASSLDTDTGTAKFDLTWYLADLEPALSGRLEYNTALYEAPTIERMLGHYLSILEAAAARPDQRLGDLPLLSAAERRTLLDDFNATRVDYPRDVCLHELIERQVERSPQAIAARCDGLEWTYRELNERSNRLAHRLRAWGVGPEARVGVCMERSLELVAALLGTLKAGGAYVPLDPEYPPERLANMLEDAQVPVLLTQKRLLNILPPHTAQVLCLDEAWPELMVESAGNPTQEATATNVAYVIFTSGSTGRPKGAMNAHSGIVNRILWMQDEYRLTPADRVFQKTPFSFDVSVWEFFWPLLTGARLVLARPGGHREPSYLVETIVKEGITTLHFVPSMLQAFLEDDGAADCAGVLRRVICSGEALPLALQQRFFQRLPGPELHNLYGPTEAAVDVTYWACDPAYTRPLVPIGRPVANTQMYVLDRWGQPTPIGVPGELHIGGVQVGLGYLNRAELTKEKFIADRFSKEPGARLYRTGDLARWLPEGVIDYLGRLDHQVKVRGFRIELGEIEAVLQRHPGVREAAVVVREDIPGSKRLVAYVVSNAEPAPTAAELRTSLGAKLPEYMVPPAFVFLAKLPLSPNGKLDRQALPAPAAEKPKEGASFAAPITVAERELARIWAETLKVDRVGVQDNFFTLGGDSILAIRVVSRAREAGLKLTPRQLFLHQTVAELAAVATTVAATSVDQGMVSGPAPLTPVQRWFFEQEMLNANHFNQALLLKAKERLAPFLFEQALAVLLRRHDVLRSRWHREADGSWRQEMLAEPAAAPVFQVIDLSGVPEPAQAAAVTEAAAKVQESLDLTLGPVTRMVWFELGAQPGRLLWVTHHLAVDAVSWRVLLEDLWTLYEQLRSDQPPSPPAKTTSYKHWAECLERAARTSSLAAEMSYWSAEVRAKAAAYPVDEPGARGGPAGQIELTLGEEETAALLREAPKAYRTRFDEVLLAGLVRALADWSGQREILVDLEGHGREPECLAEWLGDESASGIDLSRTVGWFTAIYPVLLQVATKAGPGEDLQGIKEQLRRVPRNGLGYGLLRYGSGNPEASARLKALPAATVLFNYLGQLDGLVGPLTLAAESAGPTTDPHHRLSHPLIINASVRGGSLRVVWTYDTGSCRRETVEHLSRSFGEALRTLATHCLLPEAGGFTPSDFPLAELTASDLAKLALPSGREDPERVEDVYPLTPAQQGIMFHTLEAPGTGVYVTQVSALLRGIEPAAFRRAWQRLMDRHAPLRTGVVLEALTQPLQVVRQRLTLPWAECDWRGLPATAQQTRWQELLREERHRGFDITRPPLMRVLLARVDEGAYQFVWTHHHLILDGWSLPIALRDMVTLYEADRTGSAAPALPRRYRDYIAWLGKQDLGKAEEFWRRTLADFAAPTPLGTGLSSGESGQGERRLALTAATTTTLERLVRQHGLTLNTLVQGAWAVLLGHYAGQDDVVFGQVVSGRLAELPGIESMVGMFINTLPVRVNVAPEQGLLEWLHNLQRQQAEQRDYEYSPLVRIQGWSQAPRGVPLFETLLAFENYPLDRSLREGGASFTAEGISGRDEVNYPLALAVIPGQALMLILRHDRARVDDAAAERLLGHLQKLLEGIELTPERRLSDLSLLTAAESRQLLGEWSGKETHHPDERCIHELIGEQVRLRPTAVAVVYGAESLTYAELDRRANRLAHYLRRHGVEPDKTVGICVERSLDMVVAVLGVLKAGGAYVPLNPDHAPDRLKFVLANANAVVTLTHRALHEKSGDLGVPAICLDDAATLIAQEPDKDLDVKGSPAALTYILYTSGSTGEPKGVMVSHANLRNAWHAWDEVYRLSEWRPTYLQMANFSFDVWPGDFVRALCSGGKLVLCPHEFLLEADKLHALIVREKADAIEIVPAVMRTLMRYLETTGQRLDGVRLLVVGADAWHVGEHEKLKELVGPQTRVLNSYGVTEATIDSSYFEGSVSGMSRDAVAPIGKPFPNTRFYILDKQLAPVPLGVPGELHIGGPSVARGYAGRPDLTAAKFIPNPFSTEPGARLYKTGDLARWRHTGDVEFLGRIDQQVKIRGFRIELGEIETVLARHPDVREVVVHAWADGRGEKQLAAYVVPKGAPVGIGELRAFVGKSLPSYMAPSAFVFLDSLPMTASGKLNRRALPAPTACDDGRETYLAPRNEREEALAVAWAEVLKLPRVGVNDNFFDLGGHSLLAAQAVSRASAALNRTITLRELFQNPTVAQLAACIAETERDRRPALPPIPRVPRDRPPPLSFTQLRLWLLDRLEPDNPAYSMPATLRLRGHLDIAAFKQTLAELDRRHESLRTTFADGVDEPVQIIAPPGRPPLAVVELSGVEPQELRARITAETRAPFNLSTGPLFRMILLRLDAEEHVLIAVMHHSISDGQSINVLVREFSILYRAFAANQPASLAELPIQYADYAIWQRQRLQGAYYESLLGYWKERLAGLTTLELPTDRPRPAMQRHVGSRLSVALPSELMESLRGLARREQATPFMLYLAAFQALLHRYSGQDDIVVGSPIANRPAPEIDGLIGFFANTLVLRTDCSGEPTFRELLGRVRESALGAFEHQDIPFERLVEELNPRRDTSRNPLFQVSFAWENVPDDIVNLPGLKVEKLPVAMGTAKFDLTLTVRDLPEESSAVLEYDEDLFDAGTVERMLGHFQTILQQLAANPEQSIAKVSLLPAAERQRLVVEWNDTAADYPHDQCVHQLFEAQAARTPDAAAVRFAGQEWTYRELNERANRLAHRLGALGVGVETRVGICMERSLELVAALLGVLKAGGAYVPLDPEFPRRRLEHMLADAKAPVILTQQRLLDTLPQHEARVLCVDAEWDVIVQESAENPRVNVAPDQLTYVMYTSGSTGLPKGVMVTHRGVVNFLTSMRQRPGLTSADRLLAVTTLSFDIAGLEIYLPLSTGACVVLADQNDVRDGHRLLGLLREAGVTVLQATPATWRLLIEAGWNGETPLKALCGGEALPRDLAEQLLQRCGSLWNLYGPTETTIWSTAQEITRERPAISIGRPIANTQIYILDRHGQPAPIGVPGELYIGGAGVARGYNNRPELTAERFVPDPFSPDPDARLYRTGDLARWLADGRIDCLGRLDQQVKLRGFRIELGDIEAALSRAPGVKQAVALIAGEEEKRLVAFLVPHGGEQPRVAELRDFLHERLPAYMVPGAFVVLEALPLTPNGKIDRRALPALEQAAPGEQRAFVAPRNPYEEQVAAIWADLLKVERVGANDNFFELGGHSLLAARAVNKISSAFNVQVPIRAMFDRPTVADLATYIEEMGHDGRPALPSIARVSRERALPLSFTQLRLWVLDQFQPGSAAYTISAALRLSGRLDIAALERTVSELVRRHESLRTTFAAGGDEPVQIIAAPGRPPLTIVELGAVDQRAWRERVAAETQAPFDLSAGPLFRMVLLRLADDEQILIVVMHHAIADGQSIGILIREFSVLYGAFVADKPAALPELPIQYADYAVKQHERLQGAYYEGLLGYWKERLAGLATLELPTDRPRPAVQRFVGSRRSAALPSALMDSLRGLARREQVTPFMLHLAAFQTLLHRYSGQDDIAVGTPIANRPTHETEGVIGFFVNTLVLRADCSGEPTFRELLGRVREDALGAFEHQEMPFERLVEELNPVRDTSRNPLFQVSFAWESARADVVNLPGLTTEWEPTDTGTAKFDLTLNVRESPEACRAELEYDQDLYDAGTIERMLGHFQTILEQLAANPEQSIADVSLLSTAERRRLVVEWNDTAAPYPHHQCLHQLFEAQAARTPDAVALTWEGDAVTYVELNRRANRLASYLHTLGVGAESLVGVCVERSVDMVVSLLGVLKTGGAYVPLDPTYPQERLSYMLSDSGAQVLLTQERLAALLPTAGIQVVRLDADSAAWAAASDANPPCDATPDALAYVIYTSGSTGNPKGVQGTHRGAVNRCAWMWAAYPFTAWEVACQKTALSFVDSVWEIFGPLLRGVRLVILPDALVKDPPQLIRALAAEQVSRIVLVPSLLRAMLDTGLNLRASLPVLRNWISSGEALPRDLAERFQQQVPLATLINLYGSSEVAADVTYYDTRMGVNHRSVLIGRPIWNTQMYVLDRRLRPAPVGVAGELYVAGAGLARGYHGRPDLTAERFLPNPFSTVPGSRLFKTGDQARWLPDGNIEYLGRIDGQVKVRGFRIELGEVETALAKFPAVRQGAVVVREIAPGDARLIGYVAVRKGSAPAASEIKVFLRQRLPEYMVPSAFVLLDDLPQTPSGKLDRRALGALAGQTLERVEAFVAPRNPYEEQMAAIWSDLLKVERVGANDNFFELGGHSLLAARAINKIGMAFDHPVTIRALFDNPTLGGLAFWMEEQKHKTTVRLPRLQRRAVTPERIPLTTTQEGFYFVIRANPNRPTAHIGNDVRLKGELHFSALTRALNEVVHRHEGLRMTFPQLNEAPAQIVSPYEPFEVPILDLSDLPEADREKALISQRLSNRFEIFNFAVGPLYRFKLVRLAPQDHVLLIAFHHIVFDGTSLAIFASEFLTLYQAFQTGQPSPLADLPFQFSDYVFWLQDYIAQQDLKRVEEYARKLAVNMRPIELATDFPRPRNPTRKGAELAIEFPPDLSDGIRKFHRDSGITPYMTLLAAFETVLHLYSGQEYIRVTSPVANRTPVETENLLGCFIKMSILNTHVGDDPTFAELVGRIRNDTLDAYENQIVPLTKLRALAAENQPGALNRGEPIEVMFLLQNFAKAELQMPGGPDRQSSPLLMETLNTSRLTPGSVLLADDPNAPRLLDVFNHQLELECTEKEGVFEGRLAFQTDLFRVETAERMRRYLVNILRAGIAAPNKRLSELPYLDDAERHWLLTRGRPLPASDRGDVWVHRLIEENARLAPNATAVIWERQRLTYSQLNRRANRLAHHLRRTGVGPGQTVGICLERSFDMVIAVLGVLKAGGAYVPLNPEHAADRLKYVLADSGAMLTLTHGSLRARLGDLGVPTIDLDGAASAFDQEPDSNPDVELTGAAPAYILYTSGSTGEPKGVIIGHASLLNAWRGWDDAYQLSEWRPTYLQMANFTFDVWPGDFVRALCSRGKLVLCPHETLFDADKLSALIKSANVDALEIVPVVLRNLMSGLEKAGKRLDGVRLLVVGADVWYAKEHKTLKGLVGPQTRVLNSYGVTEATIDSSIFEGDVSELPDEAIVPIGKPFANTQMYVLDRHLRLVPEGVWGELHIGGPSVALGYRNRPELTAEKFIANPFVAEPGARLYKTGDLVRWRPDGQLEFNGRLDGQVKIRGLRIETGAIEMVLKQHATIRDAVVVAHRDAPATEARLVAYLVPRPDQEVPAFLELRTFLRKQKLARHMIPSVCITLAALPLLPSGKLDRQALPLPEALPTTGYVPPNTRLQERLCAIMAQVLGVERVGIYDDFFALGGDSMKAMQVSLRARKELGLKKAPIEGLLVAPNVAELSERIVMASDPDQRARKRGGQASAAETKDEDLLDLLDDESRPEADSFDLLQYRNKPATDRLPIVTLQSHGSRPPFFLVHGIDGGAIAFAHLARAFDGERPLYALQARGLYHIGAPSQQIEEMAAYYCAAVLREQPTGPHLIGGWSMGGPVALAMARQLEQQGAAPALVVLLDPSFPSSFAKRNLKRLLKQDDTALFPAAFPQVFAYLKMTPKQYQALTPKARVEIIRTKLLRLAGAPGKIDLATMNSVLLTYRAHAQALLAHVVQPYGGRVLFLKPTGKKKLNWSACRMPAPWAPLLSRTDAFSVPGDHRGMLKKDNAQLLAEQLATHFAELERAGAAGTPS